MAARSSASTGRSATTTASSCRPARTLDSPTYAIVSESAELDTDGAEWALDTFLGTVRIRSESERAVFVGIGPAAEVDRYLEGVEHDVIDDLDSGGDPEYARRAGGAPSGRPAAETFWTASASGAGEQTLEWDPEDGDWRAVVMNEDASRGVSAEMSIGAELDSVLWIGLALLGVGMLFAAGSRARDHRRRASLAATRHGRTQAWRSVSSRSPTCATARAPEQRLRELMEEVELADEVGLDVFGVGEHHRPEFAVSAPAVVLAAAAARTKRIRLTSAVTVLSSAVPIRLYQQFATLDLLSGGRAEMMVGRGSFIESFPLFGFDLRDYDRLFEERLAELLHIRETGRSPAGHDVYPQPRDPLPVWVAVGGTPESAVRAGMLGLPMALAIIGGLPERFTPFAELHRRAAAEAGREPPRLSINSHGYIADTAQQGARRVVPVRLGGDEQDRPGARLAPHGAGRLRRSRDTPRRELRRHAGAGGREDPLPARALRPRPVHGAVHGRRNPARGDPPLDRAPRPRGRARGARRRSALRRSGGMGTERFERVPLLFGPSPVHRLERLSEHLGGAVEIWAKREDCNSGLAYGGNKVRKLEYLVAEALAGGCDTLVSIGGVQSNHTRQVAAVAARLGLGCVLVQEHWVEWPDAGYDKVGNILLSRIMGADVRLDPSGFDIGIRKSWEDALASVEESGGTPYAIPAGASDHPLGGLGFARWADEVAEQERELGVFFDTIVVCSVTGSTQAGMIAGFAAQDAGRSVLGIDGSATVRQTWEQIARIARFTAEAIELGRELDDAEVVLLDEWHAGTYGIPDEKTLEAIRLCARLEGMLTDPVYEGKSMAALIDLVQSGRDRARLACAVRAPRRAAGTERVRRRVLGLASARAEVHNVTSCPRSSNRSTLPARPLRGRPGARRTRLTSRPTTRP